MKRTRVILLAALIPLVEATSCVSTHYFYVANLSPQPAKVVFSAPCEPCASPRTITVKDLKRGRNPAYYLERQSPAPAEVSGRTDSLIMYSLSLPPDQAVMLFERTLGGGVKRSAAAIFSGFQVSAITGEDSVTYDATNAADAFRRWHKYIYVIEVK